MALSAMKSTPRSSRRRCGRGSCREDVVIGSPSLETQPLGDEVSGTGSPAASLASSFLSQAFLNPVLT